MTNVFTLQNGSELPVDLFHTPSSIMDFKDFLTCEKDGKLIVGYLVDDSDCPNPLEDCEGMGHIYTSQRFDRESNEKMREALGLNRDWEPDFELIEEDDIIDAAHKQLRAMCDCAPNTSLTQYLHALQYCEDNYQQTDDECRIDFVCRCLDNLMELDDFVNIESITKELYHKALVDGTIGNPYAISLDVYEHGGISFNVSGRGMQCQWDTARGGAVWVPDAEAEKELERRAAVYQKGYISKKNHQQDPECWIVRTFSGKGTELDDSKHPKFAEWYEAFKYLLELEVEHTQTIRQAEYDAALELAQQACEQYTSWCNGDCYGVVVETFDIATGEQLEEESCWGYVGSDSAYESLKETFTYETK